MAEVQETTHKDELHGEEPIDFNIELEKADSQPLPLDFSNVKIDYGTEASDYENFDKKIKIHWCMCGQLIEPNPSNMCVTWLSKTIDIGEGIETTFDVEQCRTCERWHGSAWGYLERESKEMLTMLLKKISVPKGVSILSSQFIWTEPHSKRMKVKITINKEVLNNTVMQKSIVVTFVEKNLQWDEWRKTFTPHTWQAVVQLRQKVSHKRTFLFLEQLILKNNAHEKCINIEEKDDGLNFYFKHRSHAISLMEFVQSQVLVRIKQSSKLVSQDYKSNTSNTKYTILIEIAPVCKDDLVLLPQKLSREWGGIGPLVLWYKISKTVNVVDVVTMETYEIDGASYWKNPFGSILDRNVLTQFVILNIDTEIQDVNESKAAKRNKFKFAEVEVQRVYETTGKTYFTYTHLGESLNFDDTVLAYDLESANLKDEQMSELEKSKKRIPEVIIVRKTYPRTREKRKQKKRTWKLKHFAVQKGTTIDDIEEAKEKAVKAGGKKAAKISKKLKKEEKHLDSKNQDYEIFLQDLEEDKELRSQIKLYKNEEVKQDSKSKRQEIKKDEKKDTKEPMESAKDEEPLKANEETAEDLGAKENAEDKEQEIKEDENEDENPEIEENFPDIQPDELE